MPTYQYKCPVHGIFDENGSIRNENLQTACPVPECAKVCYRDYNYGDGKGPITFTGKDKVPFGVLELKLMGSLVGVGYCETHGHVLIIRKPEKNEPVN